MTATLVTSPIMCDAMSGSRTHGRKNSSWPLPIPNRCVLGFTKNSHKPLLCPNVSFDSVSQALFDLRMTRKQKAPTTNRVTAPIVVAPNTVTAEVYKRPHPVGQRLSATGANRRALLNEFAEATAANQRAAALSLEQTLNETQFNVRISPDYYTR